MVILLLVCITLLVCCCAYLYHRLSQEKNKSVKLDQKKIPEKDLKFLDFTVEMYIKYAKDLDIHSTEQHEFIVKELERIRKEHLNNEI